MITVSNVSLFNTYGEEHRIEGVASILQYTKLTNIKEAPFDPEHIIESRILIISGIFPNTKVTPIILRSDTTRSHAEALSKTIIMLLNL